MPLQPNIPVFTVLIKIMSMGLKRPRELRKKISGQQRVFHRRQHGQIRSQPVQINRSIPQLLPDREGIAPAGPQSAR